MTMDKHDLILKENETGTTGGSIIYPGLSVCLGITVVAPSGEKAGAHLCPGGSFAQNLANLQYCWAFYSSHRPGARFVLSCQSWQQVNSFEIRLEDSVENHTARQALEIYRNILATMPFADVHTGLHTDAGPIHYIRADGQPAAKQSELQHYGRAQKCG